jgi:hypothetical protein
MKMILGSTALALVIATTTIPAEAKGCIKGAIVGGTAGHFAGHHGLMGAAAGCNWASRGEEKRESGAIPALNKWVRPDQGSRFAAHQRTASCLTSFLAWRGFIYGGILTIEGSALGMVEAI